MRVVVLYDPSFSKIGTWMLAAELGGIRVRFRLSDGPEHIVDARLHWMNPRRLGSVYVRPLDETTWLTEASKFDGQIDLAVVLQLNGATEYATAALRLL